MTDNSTRRPIRLRTFAADLESKRGGSEPSASTPIVPHEGRSTSAKTVVSDTAHKNPKKEPRVISEPNIVVSKTEPRRSDHTPSLPDSPDLPPKATKIPAFHELKKSINTIQENIVSESEHPKKHSDKTDKKAKRDHVSQRPNIGYDATVITDTKSARFKLLPSIIDSIQRWFKQLARNRSRKKTPTYTVPETERRKGVIQRATTKTGTIFSADSETLREQIRQRRLEEAAKRTSAENAETVWTPFTETGFPLLEAPDEAPANNVQNVTVEYKRKPQFIEPSIKPEPPRPYVPPAAAIPPTKQQVEPIRKTSDELAAESRWSAIEEVPPEPIPQERVAAITDNEAPQRLTVESEAEMPEDLPVTVYPVRRIRRRKFSFTDTNTLTLTILACLLAVAAIAFATYSIFIKETADVQQRSLPEQVLKQAKFVPVTPAASDIAIFSEFVGSTIASSSAGLVEYAIITPSGEEIAAEYLFSILGFQTMPSLRQSLSSLRFASINNSEPLLILNFTDVDTVRGGLLAWEDTMASDLTGLFGIETQATPLFTDETIAGVDVRIFKDNGETIVVYGFLNENTAFIAGNFADFAQLVQLASAE
jgi:hypothetical protein